MHCPTSGAGYRFSAWFHGQLCCYLEQEGRRGVWEVKSEEIDCGAKPATFPNEYYHELFMQTQMNGWNDKLK